MNRLAVGYALISAALFGLSTPAAKALLGAVAPLMLAVADALRHVYLVAGLLALIGFAATFGLPRGLSPTRPAHRAKRGREGGLG